MYSKFAVKWNCKILDSDQGKRLREESDDDEQESKNKVIKLHLDMVIANLNNTLDSIKALRELF